MVYYSTEMSIIQIIKISILYIEIMALLCIT